MTDYVLAKWLHILSSTFLFGTGVGSAFYLLAISLRHDIHAIASITRHVVIADCIFTATTAIFQPLSGLWLLRIMGIPATTPWVQWSFILFAIAIACWLPVIWIQIRLRDIAQVAASHNNALPAAYWFYFKCWVALGLPALFAFLGVFYLMVAKPV
jgi:uncharacterized membrane protein